MTPIIAQSPQFEDGEDRFSLKFAYSDAIISAGAIPFVISPNEDEKYIEKVLEVVDGILLTGGDDVAPELYGEEKSENCGTVCKRRDEFEILLARRALDRGIPLLGICRGVQVMNVCFGGTLYQDMPSHKQDKPKNEPSHSVKISGDILGIYPENAFVNSFHHQAIKDVSIELDVCAVSDDGYVEGVYKRDTDFFIGVQWHPELMVKSDKYAQRLFSAFVSACIQYKEKKNAKGSCS